MDAIQIMAAHLHVAARTADWRIQTMNYLVLVDGKIKSEYPSKAEARKAALRIARGKVLHIVEIMQADATGDEILNGIDHEIIR